MIYRRGSDSLDIHRFWEKTKLSSLRIFWFLYKFYLYFEYHFCRVEHRKHTNIRKNSTLVIFFICIYYIYYCSSMYSIFNRRLQMSYIYMYLAYAFKNDIFLSLSPISYRHCSRRNVYAIKSFFCQGRKYQEKPSSTKYNSTLTWKQQEMSKNN